MLSKENQNKMYLLQKRIIQAICGARFRDHCMPLLKSQNVLTIHDSLLVENCKLMFRVTNNLAPIPVVNLFVN